MTVQPKSVNYGLLLVDYGIKSTHFEYKPFSWNMIHSQGVIDIDHENIARVHINVIYHPEIEKL